MRPFDVLDIEVFGESHSPEIGAVLRGLPADSVFDPEKVRQFAERRRSGKYLFSTPRREKDETVWTGCVPCEGGLRTKGVIEARIENSDIRPADYTYFSTPRPSHADYCARVKDGDGAARSGGGRFSGRMTAPLVALGGVAEQLLEKRGVFVGAYIGELAGVKARGYAEGAPSPDEIRACHERALPMLSHIDEATEATSRAVEVGDSVGGIVECVAYGLPAGLGDALFNGLESKLSAALFAIPAVKGVSFGAGSALAEMRGSEANDAFILRDGKVETLTNNAGGINGGISNGMPVTLRVVFRPTPSISVPQRTVDLDAGMETELRIKGRHDATVVPRATVVVESMVALALLDAILNENQTER